MTLPAAQMAALVTFVLVFVPQFRVFAVVLLILGIGGVLGLFLYRSDSSGIKSNPFRRLDVYVPLEQAARNPAIPRPSEVNDLIAQLRNIDWFQFEKALAVVFRNLGYSVTRRGGANPDGGIDLELRDGTDCIAVQCKQWRTTKIRENIVREFLGALTHAKISKGLIVTLCGYTQEAKRLADAHAIQILCEKDVEALLRDAKAEQNVEIQAALRDPRKFCPKCESKMLVRTARKGSNNGSRFWGCSTYPRCHYTMPLVT